MEANFTTVLFCAPLIVTLYTHVRDSLFSCHKTKRIHRSVFCSFVSVAYTFMGVCMFVYAHSCGKLLHRPWFLLCLGLAIAMGCAGEVVVRGKKCQKDDENWKGIEGGEIEIRAERGI